jgi:hypothetical protein
LRPQLSLDLEFSLGDAVPLNTLAAGERFVRDGTEGQLVRISPGSGTVKILRENGKWETTQWSPLTTVRRLRA